MKEILEEEIIKDKIQLYKNNFADQFIIDILIKQKQINNPKKYGVMMEKVAQKILGLSNSTNSEHDKIFNNKKLEIKTSSMEMKHLSKGIKYFQYNSIRLDYDYDYLLIQNINFNSIDYYILSKKQIKSLSLTKWNQKQKKKDIIQMINFDEIKDYVVEINDRNINSIL